MAAQVPDGGPWLAAISDTSDLNDVAMGEPDTINDAGRPDSTGYEVAGQTETATACGQRNSDPEAGEDMSSGRPHPHGTRTHDLGAHVCGQDASIEDEAAGYDPKEGVVRAAAVAALAALTDEMLFQRLEKMLTTDPDGPVRRPRRSRRASRLLIALAISSRSAGRVRRTRVRACMVGQSWFGGLWRAGWLHHHQRCSS